MAGGIIVSMIPVAWVWDSHAIPLVSNVCPALKGYVKEVNGEW